MKKIALIAVSTLALTACVTQQQADEKMVKGCQAGVTALITPKEIKEVKTTNGSDEVVEGQPHRRITLTVVEKDGWLEIDKEYSCLFAQEWGLFKSSHRALLVQTKIDDSIYGKVDGQISGSIDDFVKLTDTVDQAMGQ
jgi:hypothetical protein